MYFPPLLSRSLKKANQQERDSHYRFLCPWAHSRRPNSFCDWLQKSKIPRAQKIHRQRFLRSICIRWTFPTGFTFADTSPGVSHLWSSNFPAFPNPFPSLFVPSLIFFFFGSGAQLFFPSDFGIAFQKNLVSRYPLWRVAKGSFFPSLFFSRRSKTLVGPHSPWKQGVIGNN